ncbi:MAG: hypothetical protein ACYDAE_08020 [Steroidobacteraceae bacterium]
MRNRPLRDAFDTLDIAEPAYRAEAIDEYRDLVMLAHAWEHRPLEPEGAEEAPDPGDDAAGRVGPIL